MNGVVERPHGIRLPYAVEGTGPNHLVYAHGLNGQGAAARFQTRGLVEAGWTVATYDQRGHGAATPVRDALRYALEEMAADLLAVMDAAGWERAWIGGGSMGAAVSLVAALTAPERVEGLLQVAPAVSAQPHPFFRALQSGDAAALRDLGRLEAVRLRREDAMRGVQLVAPDTDSLKVANATVTQWTLDGFPSVVGRLDVPIAVVAWEDDPIHPADVARAIAAHARRASLHVHPLDALGEDGALERALAPFAS